MTSLTQKSQACGYNERIVQHNLHVKPDLPPTACRCIHNFYGGSCRVNYRHPVKFNSIWCVWAKNKDYVISLWTLDKSDRHRHRHHHQRSPVVIVGNGFILSAAQRKTLIKRRLCKPSTTDRTSMTHQPLSPSLFIITAEGPLQFVVSAFRATHTCYIELLQNCSWLIPDKAGV